MEKGREITKREIYGEILKDQYITNAELLFNELIGGTEYLINDINKMQSETPKDDNELAYYENLAKENKRYETMKARARVCKPTSTSVVIDCDTNEIKETKKDLTTGESKDTIVHFRNCLIKECGHNEKGFCTRKDVIDGLTQCDFENNYGCFKQKEK